MKLTRGAPNQEAVNIKTPSMMEDLISKLDGSISNLLVLYWLFTKQSANHVRVTCDIYNRELKKETPSFMCINIRSTTGKF